MERKIVYVVDDDEPVRDSAARFVRVAGYDAETFPTADDFLRALPQLRAGCVVLDIHMPGLSGLDAQRILRERGCDLPVIMLTGAGDISMAVQAMKNGAIEFIEKPYDHEALLGALTAGFERLEQSLGEAAARDAASAAVGRLTPRERQVLEGLLAGLPNKLISYELGLSTRTVEVYRGNLMEKLAVRSLSAALRLALAAGVQPLGGESRA